MLQPNGDQIVTTYQNPTHAAIPASQFEFTPPLGPSYHAAREIALLPDSSFRGSRGIRSVGEAKFDLVRAL